MGAMALGASVLLVGVVAAWRGSIHMDRIFGHVGDYSAAPRPYPDQDPAPIHNEVGDGQTGLSGRPCAARSSSSSEPRRDRDTGERRQDELHLD